MILHHLARAAVTLSVGVALLAVADGCSKSRPGVTRTAVGNYVNYYPAPSDEVYAAAQEVIRELQLMVVEGGKTQSEGHYRLVARNAQDTRISIDLVAAGPDSTRGAIKVRPGWSEGLSVRIHQMINDRLR